MAMPNDLILVRHGESEGNVAVKAAKSGDMSHMQDEEFARRHSSWWRLTEQGQEQAKIAGAWVRENIGTEFDRYYTSSFTRAMETAALLDLPEARWYIDFRLRERERGHEDLMSLLSQESLEASRLARLSSPLFWRPLGGESIADICIRLRDFIATLQREMDSKRVIIVCHGEVMEAFRVIMDRMTQSDYARFTNDPAEHILNGQVYHYTRCNPHAPFSRPSKYLSWFRSVRTTGPGAGEGVWIPVHRPVFGNDELLNLAHETPRIIA